MTTLFTLRVTPHNRRHLTVFSLLAACLALAYSIWPHVTTEAGAAFSIATFQQKAKLTASDGESDDRFGNAAAVSADGKTIVIGARTDDLGATPNQGSVYIYEREGIPFVFKQQLFASGGVEFGTAVAIDGDTIAVGSPGELNEQGAIYIFVKQAGVWQQQQRLLANDGAANDHLGFSVALSGNTVLVGAYGADINGKLSQGAAYTFKRTGAVWMQETKLTAADGAQADVYGYSVALDGDVAAIGAAYDQIGSNNVQGSVYVHRRSAGVWSAEQKLTAADGDASDVFGAAVALDGNTLLVGAPYDSTILASLRGSTYVFQRTNGVWNQQAKLVADDGASGDNFGNSVALRGNTAVVGAPQKNVNVISNQGVAYIFARSGANWEQEQRLMGSLASNAYFGSAVALNGETLVSGAPGEQANKGSLNAYRPLNTPPQITAAQFSFERSAGSGTDNMTIANVTDPNQPLNTLQMLVEGAASSTKNGVTVSNLAVNASGAVTANVNIACGATSTFFAVRVTDDEGEFNNNIIQFNITPNTPPSLAYGFLPHTVGLGGSHTIHPSSGPSDNGTINFVSLHNITPAFSGSITVLPTGVISIANAAPAGNYAVTIRAQDTCGLFNDTSFTLTVNAACPAPTVNPPALPNGAAGAFYNQTLTTTGGVAPFNFAVTSGALPNGFTLAANGTLSGTTATVGDYNFTVRATGANGCQGTRAYTLSIGGLNCNVSFPAMLMPVGNVGQPYNVTFAATGGTAPYTYAVTAGAVPNGLNLSAAGALSGTVTQAGDFNFTLRATDANGCQGTRQVAIHINGVIQPITGLQFYPLAQPIRLLDTRAGFSGCDAPGAPIAGGTSRTQTAAGRTCGGLIIPANAKALTGNITTVQSGGGYLTLYPSDAVQPLVANTNYAPNEILNNVFTVGLGAGDGAFKIFAVNNTHVVVDVTGYYAPPSAQGLYFHPLPKPVRLLDTRPGMQACFTPGAPLPQGSNTPQLGQTTCDGVLIPAGARALVGNATTVNPQNGGYLTLYPADAAQPLVASSNFTAGQVMNAPFTVGLASGGFFNIFTTTTTDLVVDVLGYYSADANDANGAGLLFNPLPAPVRLLETRAGFTGCYTPGAPLAAATPYTQAGSGACVNIPATARGIIGNATVVNAQAGYLTFWPSNAAQPLVANSNYLTGQVLNRHFTAGLGPDGAFKLFASAQTDLVIDVTGYFVP